MKGRTRPLVQAALGALLAATNVAASAPAVVPETQPLQFTSAGHIVAFTSRDLHVASGSHALRVEFIGARNVAPVAEGAAAPDGTSAPLNRVAYPGIWEGITLVYDAPGALLRSTYTLAPGADPARIRLRYNAPVAVEPGGGLRVAFSTGAMRESAPVAWQDIGDRRVAVAAGFRTASEREVGFSLGPYDQTRPLTIDPTLSWNTFLGGGGGDDGSGIAVDASGNVYVAGYSAGTWGNPKRAWAGTTDAFVAKLDAGGALLWNTFLGGAGDDRGYGIAVDASGAVSVTGYSAGTWGDPTLPWAGSYDAFVARLDTNGALLWNAFLGCSSYDHGYGVAVDASGNAYVTGYSEGTWGEPKLPWAGSYDAFVAKLGADGALLWNTFLGGAGDKGYGIAVDGGGNAYVTGYSAGTWGNPKRAWAGGYDACVAKLDTGGALLWNTFLGSPAHDGGSGIAVDANGNAYVTGFSDETWGDNPKRPFSGGVSDAFVAKLDSDGGFLWNTFLGGTGWDGGAGIAVDASGEVSVTGGSASTWGAPTWAFAGGYSDAFVAGLDTDGALLRNDFLGESLEDDGSGVAVDASGHIYVTGKSYSTWGDPRLPWAGDHDAFVAKTGVAIIVNPANQPPALLPVADRAAAEGAPIEFTVQGTDPEGKPIAYSVDPLPAGARLGADTGLFRWVPRLDQAGTYRLAFTATDGALTSDPAAMTITVSNPNGPLFSDDFADGAAPGDWINGSGIWSGSQGVFASRSLKKNNLARIASLDPIALPLGTGAVQAKVKLTSTSSIRGPNGMVIFAYQDATRYRWVRIRKNDLSIGQTGLLDGVGAGTKRKVARRHAIGRFVLLTVKIHPDGWVRVYESVASRPVAEFCFTAGGRPSVVPGGAGLAASKAKTVFDNVKVWEDSALVQ